MIAILKVLSAGTVLAVGGLALVSPAAAHGSAPIKKETDHNMGARDLDQVRELHKGHAHGHDFEAMEAMSPEQQTRVMGLMHEIGVAVPPMDPIRGRQLLVETGCVACHAVNGVGGDLGPALDAHDMPKPMNAFEFAARMWRGAEAMTALQTDLMGAVISLDGQDLADLVAFAHDEAEQGKLTKDQIPARFHALIEGE